MDTEEYQEKTSYTANQEGGVFLETEIDSDIDNKKLLQLNWALGLSGEAGEIADLIKKGTFHGHELTRKDIIDECSDVMWYLSELLNLNDISMEEVMEYNINKLRERYPEGFSQEDSKNRD